MGRVMVVCDTLSVVFACNLHLHFVSVLKSRVFYYTKIYNFSCTTRLYKVVVH